MGNSKIWEELITNVLIELYIKEISNQNKHKEDTRVNRETNARFHQWLKGRNKNGKSKID